MKIDSRDTGIGVCTWNLWGQVRNGYLQRSQFVTRTAESLSWVNIFGFQEFGYGRKNKGIDNWSALKLALPRHHLYRGVIAGDILINPIAYNQARFSLVNSGTFWLTPDGQYGRGWDGDERGASWVLLRDNHPQKQNKLLVVLNTHFSNIGVRARIKSTHLIIEFVREHFPELPIVITADLNINLSNPYPFREQQDGNHWLRPRMALPIQLLYRAGFQDAWVASHPDEIPAQLLWLDRAPSFHDGKGPNFRGDTWGAYDPDYLWFWGLRVRFCQIVYELSAEEAPSDHRPIVTVFDYED